jgi:hypothetical protein
MWVGRSLPYAVGSTETSVQNLAPLCQGGPGPGVPERTRDPLDLGLLAILSPSVKLHKLPSNVESWVVPDLTVMRELAVDINSNVQEKETPKSSLPEETGTQGHSPKSSGLFIRKSMIRQANDAENRAEDVEDALMADLSQNITHLCDTSEEGEFIGPDLNWRKLQEPEGGYGSFPQPNDPDWRPPEERTRRATHCPLVLLNTCRL